MDIQGILLDIADDIERHMDADGVGNSVWTKRMVRQKRGGRGGGVRRGGRGSVERIRAYKAAGDRFASGSGLFRGGAGAWDAAYIAAVA